MNEKYQLCRFGPIQFAFYYDVVEDDVQSKIVFLPRFFNLAMGHGIPDGSTPELQNKSDFFTFAELLLDTLHDHVRECYHHDEEFPTLEELFKSHKFRGFKHTPPPVDYNKRLQNILNDMTAEEEYELRVALTLMREIK